MTELNKEIRDEFKNFRIINEVLRKDDKRRWANDRIHSSIYTRIWRAKKNNRVEEELFICLEVAKRLRKELEK
jgi:hypothetical protein